MEESHQLSLSTKEYKMLIKLVASGQFIINAPYAPWRIRDPNPRPLDRQ